MSARTKQMEIELLRRFSRINILLANTLDNFDELSELADLSDVVHCSECVFFIKDYDEAGSLCEGGHNPDGPAFYCSNGTRNLTGIGA